MDSRRSSRASGRRTPVTPSDLRTKVLRSATKSPAVTTPLKSGRAGVRKSTRNTDKVPYNLLEVSTDTSPEVGEGRATRSRTNTPAKKPPGKAKPVPRSAGKVKPGRKRSVPNEAESDDEDSTVRKSVGKPKQAKRVLDEAGILAEISSSPAKNTRQAATPKKQGESKLTRTSTLSRGRKKTQVPKPKSESDSEEQAAVARPRRQSTRRKVTPLKLKVPAKTKTTRKTTAKNAPDSQSEDDEEEDEDDVEDEPTPSTSKQTRGKGKAKTGGKVTEEKAGVKPSAEQSQTLEWKFNVYGVPTCPLPCREEQFEDIWKFLFENVTERNSGCLYVSGVPGTGKTVIVQAVVDTLQKLAANKDKKKKEIKFNYLYVNGLTLASPDKIWKRMFKGLGLATKTKVISTKEALKRLDSYFETTQRIPVILVVDELDQILDKQQSILYQLLEWSSHARNMFSFVAIFNTMSLPENGLAMRNYSRMGFKRSVFPPYNFEQLQTIVSNMLGTFKNVRLNSEAISLLSRKVAAISGDARRALEIARRAMEIAESNGLSGIQAVSGAFKEIFSSAKIETIKHTSLLEQLVLRSVCDEIRSSGMEEVLVAKIYESVIPKAAYEGMCWHKDEILKAMMRLAIMRLIIVEDNSPSIHKRVLLKVPVEDVNFALGIHNDLEC